MRRLSTAFLLLGLVMIIALLPLRPVLIDIWPTPVEERVTSDGGWVLVPAMSDQNAPDRGILRARTRPLSLVELRTVHGGRVYGYIIEPDIEPEDTSSGERALRIQTGPDAVQTIARTDVLGMLYPNDMSVRERLEAALRQLRNRHSFS